METVSKCIVLLLTFVNIVIHCSTSVTTSELNANGNTEPEQLRWKRFFNSGHMNGLSKRAAPEASKSRRGAKKTQMTPMSEEGKTDMAGLVEETSSLLDEGHRRIHLDPTREYVLIVGKAGTGKSTMALLLTGDNSKLIATKAKGEYFIQQENPAENIIGTKTTVSKSIFPQPFTDLETDTVYYDCPGFADSRKNRPHIDIANAMFIKKVADHAKKLKIILAVNHFSVRPSTSDRNDFLDTLTHLRNLLPNAAKFQHGLGMVVTKVESEDPDEEVVHNIAEFLSDVRDQMEETTSKDEYENRMALLDALLSEDEDGKFNRISVFRKPKKTGPLSENEVIQENKVQIKEMVGQMEFVEHTQGDIGYVLSDNVLLLTMDIHALIKANVTETINFWAESLKSHLEEEWTNLLLLASNCPTCTEHDVRFQTFRNNFNLIQEFTFGGSKFQSLAGFITQMKRTEPIIEEKLLEKVENDAASLEFLGIVDKRINSTDWTVLKLGLEKTANSISEHLKKNYEECQLQAKELVGRWSSDFQDQTKRQLTELITETGEIKREILFNSTREDLLFIRTLSNRENETIGFTFDLFVEQLSAISNVTTKPSMILTNILAVQRQMELFHRLDSLEYPAMKYSSFNATLDAASNEIEQFLGSTFYFKARHSLEKSLKLITEFIKAEFGKQLVEEEFATLQDFLHFTKSEENRIKLQKANFTEDLNEAMTVREAWLISLKGLDSYLPSRSEPLKEIDFGINFGIDCLELGSILVDNFPSEPQVFLEKLWEPLSTFMKTINDASDKTSAHFDHTKKELVIRGNVISLEDVLKRVKKEWAPDEGVIERLTILANHTVFIDSQVIGSQVNPNGLHSFAIIAPKWSISSTLQDPIVNLDGVPGATHPVRSMVDGESGKPGLPGGNAGHFFGLALMVHGEKEFTVSVNGGAGGPGEDGQKGTNGADGEIASVSGGHKVFAECEASRTSLPWTKFRINVYYSYFGYDCSCYEGGWIDFYGSKGSPGKDGGHGGKGGQGGAEGTSFFLQGSTKVTATKTPFTRGIQGPPGLDGNGGLGGIGGKKGDTKLFGLDTHVTDGKMAACIFTFGIACAFPIDERCVYNYRGTRESTERAVGGSNGVNGLSDNGIILPPPQKKYSVTEYSVHLNQMKSSAIGLEYSDDQDIKILLQPSVTDFFKRSDVLLKNQGFSSVILLYQEFIDLHKASWVMVDGQKTSRNAIMTEFYQSLISRVESQMETEPMPERKALRFLYAAILNKEMNMKGSFVPLLVVDIGKYLTAAVTDVHSFQKNHSGKQRLRMIRNLRNKYKSGILAKRTEAQQLVENKLKPEVERILEEKKGMQNRILDELNTISSQSEQNLQALESKRKKLDQLQARGKLLSTVSLFSGLLTSPVLMTSLVEVGVSAWNTGFAASTADSGLRIVEASINQLKQQLVQVKNQITKVQEQMPSALEEFNKGLQKFQGAMESQSLATLQVGKLEVQTFLKTMRRALRSEFTSLTEKADEEMIKCFEMLDSAMVAMIQVYEAIQDLQQQSELAEYIAEVEEASSGQWYSDLDANLQAKVVEANVLLSINVLLTTYQHALTGFKLWAFPFAHYFLEDFKLSMPQNAKYMNSTAAWEDTAMQVADNMEKLKNRVLNYYSSVTPIDSIRHWVDFKGSPASSIEPDPSKSFFVVNRKDVIHRLLEGQQIVLYADVRTRPHEMDAIKFRSISVRFRMADSQLEMSLSDELNANFSVNMTHLGNSQFVCDKKVFLVTTSPLSLVWSFASDIKQGVTEKKNLVVDKLARGDVSLSPYALWEIQLIPNNGVVDYTSLSSIVESTDSGDAIWMEVNGQGSYVTPGEIKSETLEEYYSSVDAL